MRHQRLKDREDREDFPPCKNGRSGALYVDKLNIDWAFSKFYNYSGYYGGVYINAILFSDTTIFVLKRN
jgi:hypothetical protein